MITLEVLNIDSSFSVEDGSVQDFIVFRLPDGSVRRALSDEDTTKRIIDLAVQSSPEKFTEASKKETGLEATDNNNDPKIAWKLLDDDKLSPRMKRAMAMLDAPEVMRLSNLQRLMDNIVDNFADDDWARVDASMEKVPSKPVDVPAEQPQAKDTKPPKPRPAPSINKVQWADGSPIVSGGNPPRTVPADEKGYPIVPGGPDKGELVADDADEDGIEQF